MLYELNDDRIDEFNKDYIEHIEGPIMGESIAVYQSSPPWISSWIAGCMLLIPIPDGVPICPSHGGYYTGINTTVNNCTDLDARYNIETANSIMSPLLGYLVGAFLWQSVQLIACTTKHERSFNKGTTPCERMAWNVKFTNNKLSCPPLGTVANLIATTFWSSTTTVIYALLGSNILWLTPDEHSAADIAIAHAIGGAVVPGIVTSFYVIHNICKYGEVAWCAPADYYTSTIPTCWNVKMPSLSCWTCVSSDATPVTVEDIQTAIPVDIDELLDARQREQEAARPSALTSLLRLWRGNEEERRTTGSSASTSLLRQWGGDEEEQAEPGKRTAPILFSDTQAHGSIGSWTGNDSQQQQIQLNLNRASRFSNCVVS